MSKKQFEVITGKGYFSSARKPLVLFNKNNLRENLATSMVRHLSTCTREGCNKVETSDKRFKRCSVCFTKYCSLECYIFDHKHGQHKQKCKYFKMAKEIVKKTLCESCWKDKWEEVSNPNSNVIFLPCKSCMFKPHGAPKELLDDTDIYKTWFF